MVKAKKLAAMITMLAVLLGGFGWGWAEEGLKININTASADELTQLKGIGAKTAEKIVAYRQQNGPFQNPQDITAVKGVGSKTFERNKACITVE